MGLWLKCPGCQAQNPLSVKICPHCGGDLDKLPAAQRVYVMGPAAAPPATSKAPAAAAASESGPASPQAGAAPKPAKKPKGTTKKKS
jgi:predicted amidophosphoribosyltransferase